MSVSVDWAQIRAHEKTITSQQAREACAKAADLLEDPARYTTCTYARGPDGDFCEPFDPDATCFCAVGAVAHVLDCSVGSVEKVLDDLVGWPERGVDLVTLSDRGGREAAIAKLREMSRLPAIAT